MTKYSRKSAHNYDLDMKVCQNQDFPKAFFSVILCHFSVEHVSMMYRQIQHGQQNTDPTSISVKTVSNL